MRITNSQSKTYLRCPQQYDYKFRQLLTPRRVALPLERGGWLHDLLEAHYEGGDWKAAHAARTLEFMRMFEEEREYYGDLPRACENIMRSYLHWWRDADEEFKVITVEQKFECDLPNGNLLVFKVDGIIENDYGLWLMEHKSHKKIPNDAHRFIDMQSSRYVWALQQLGWDIQGVMWNYIRTKEPSKPKLLKSGERLSAAKCDTDLFTYVRALKEYGLNPRDYRDKIISLKENNTFFRREYVPKPRQVMETLVRDIDNLAGKIEDERGEPPLRNITYDCAHHCDFLQLCMTELYGGDGDQVRKLMFRSATTKDYYGLEGLAEGLQVGE